MKRCMAAAVLAMAGTAMAEEHFDLWLTLDGAGRLATGAISEDGSATALGVRVFGAELGGVLPNFADEPGMQSPDGTFEGGSRFGLSILRAVRVWDGTDFATVSASRFQVDFGPSSAVSPLADEVVSGIELAADAGGGLHDHPTFTLLEPADGVYLLEMAFRSDRYGDTLPFWFVFNNNRTEEEHDAAIEWTQDNLVPAPGSAVLAGLIAVGGLRRRARR